MEKKYIPLVAIGILLLLGGFAATQMLRQIPVGYVGVATLFGEAQETAYEEGMHFVNPFFEWVLYDVREQSLRQQASVPSQDQLYTEIAVSVQYRLDPQSTPQILQEIGRTEDVVRKIIEPNVQSLLREQGKTIQRAEDFFQEQTLVRLQTKIESDLISIFEPKGIQLIDLLIRDIDLPPFITRAIEAKKEREQEVEKQKAELERFRTEQEQRIAEAEARRRAAEEEAQQRRVLADAQAYEIERVTTAIAGNPAYIQLQALEALKAISENPASKVYFLNGDSPQPLPLMNMGDSLLGSGEAARGSSARRTISGGN